ncbi:DMT family transporter [Aliihoeflea sp. 40Bstr573]|uniref:DMT family transporter n=1 Tax=Aliihoeflea sp. 40Bstr573 TaxID=2696467 RepID=UPI002094E819|nr:DMT family transporter [Aliihoeflea sp. 40Bstr573]MCO6385658.1 EamA family transporter [Aliihoeflea sp. 40Bstr573]
MAAMGATTIERRDAIDAFAVVMMLMLTCSWGLNQVAIKIANTGYSPIYLTMARSAIAAVLVYGWCVWRGIRLFERDGTLWPGILAGALFAAEFMLIFFGLDYTTAARGALMINTMPFWVLIGAHFLLGERITATKLLGLTMAFFGVALVFLDQLSLPDNAALIGDLMCLAAGILWGATTLVIKKSKLSDASAEKTLLYQLVVSVVVAVPLLPLGGPILRDVSALATGSLLFQAIFVVAFTYILWFWMIRTYPATGLASFAFLTPAFGVLCGGFLLNEPLSINIFAALALIALGLLVVNRPVRRRIPPG